MFKLTATFMGQDIMRFFSNLETLNQFVSAHQFENVRVFDCVAEKEWK